MHISTILAATATFTVVNAHFTLDYPPTRGFDEDKEPQFCGGFSVANRSQFPLKGGFVAITSHHPKSDFVTMISFDNNPTTFANFNKTPSGSPIPFVIPFEKMNAEGSACIPVNISSLGVADAHDGANATLLVQFDGGDGNLYQCADVVLSSNFSIPSGTQCLNATGAFAVSSSSPSSSPSSSSPSASASASSSSSAVTNNIGSALSMIMSALFGFLMFSL